MKNKYTPNPLSKREIEVLTLRKRGNSCKEIAFILNISTRTVENHIYRIQRKLGTHSSVLTVVKAMKYGLIR